MPYRHQFFALACALFCPTAARADDGAAFCAGRLSFVEHVGADGGMIFSVMGATAESNIIEVTGKAVPHAGGWRYQQLSSSSPEDRCTLDISPSAGGYSMHTIEGARCVNSGGHGASGLLEHASFPAASRLKGVSAPFNDAKDIPYVDCKKRKLGEALPDPGSMLCGTAGAPAEVIASVVKIDLLPYGEFYADKPTALMRRYFTDAFNASWANAMTHNGQEPVLDGDPLTGFQGVKAIRLLSTSAPSDGGDTAKVTANLLVTLEGAKPAKHSVVLTMKREIGSWKIDDMTAPVNGTIRNYFRKSYGV